MSPPGRPVIVVPGRAVLPRRDRGRRIGTTLFALVLLAAAGGVVWFGYRESQNKADTNASAEAADDGPSVAGSDRALGQMPEIDQVLDMLDDEPAVGTCEPGQQNIPPRVAGRSLESTVRVYASAAPEATFAEFHLGYDLLDDHTMVTIHDTVDLDAPVLFVLCRGWYFTINEAGVILRVQRTPASLDPAPDTALAAAVTESMVLPDAARPFAAPVALGGLAEGTVAFQLDVAGFQAAAPDVFQTWLATWTGSPTPFPSMERNEPVPVEQLPEPLTWIVRFARDHTRLEADVLGGVELPAAGTIVVLRVGDDGRLVEAAVRSVDLDIRTEWVFQGQYETPIWLGLPADGWIPVA